MAPSFIYNTGIALYDWGIAIASLWSTKARLLRNGRRGLLSHIAAHVQHDKRVVWVHAASLGEFEQGRPIIEQIRATIPDCKIVLTFFSPSGYEIRKGYDGADHIFYLPSDRPKSVKQFLDIVHPDIAIFIKYEFWLNYLYELRQRNIDTYLVSAIFRRGSIFFRPWGGAWREALRHYKRVFVQNDDSARLIAEIGVTDAIVAGDTRFDRVSAIARSARQLPIIESFKGDSKLFVAGSTWDKDEELLISLMNNNPDIRFVIAPHEIEDRRIEHLMSAIRGGARRYTESTPNDDFSSTQLLVLDTIGLLSSTYRYAHWAYIGGGFGHGIHNTLEAATFGLPIAFGTNYHKFREARELIELGSARCVHNAAELEQWFAALNADSPLYEELSHKARNYTQSNCGATECIVRTIINDMKR